MSTFTAQILVGRSHTYDGGIYGITHTLYLSENSRPAWVLQNAGDDKNQMIWIPTVEHMLEDAMLMIGIYVLKDEALEKMKESYFFNKKENYIELYDDIESHHLQEMRTRCRELTSNGKMMISVFDGSSIQKQLPAIRSYDFDIEVCQSVYLKAYNAWNRKREERGEMI